MTNPLLNFYIWSHDEDFIQVVHSLKVSKNALNQVFLCVLEAVVEVRVDY